SLLGISVGAAHVEGGARAADSSRGGVGAVAPVDRRREIVGRVADESIREGGYQTAEVPFGGRNGHAVAGQDIGVANIECAGAGADLVAVVSDLDAEGLITQLVGVRVRQLHVEATIDIGDDLDIVRIGGVGQRGVAGVDR